MSYAKPLYLINNQGFTGPTGDSGPQGIPGTSTNTGATGPTGPNNSFVGYWGSFWNDLSQNIHSVSGPTGIAGILTNTDPNSNGVSVVSSSRITVQYSGVYNIQFSAQVGDSTSGGSYNYFYIWLSKNGVNVDSTNTRVTLDNQNSFIVAAWNFILRLNAGDYIQLMFYTPDQGINLLAVHSIQSHIGVSEIPPLPKIPSLILTVQQVSA